MVRLTDPRITPPGGTQTLMQVCVPITGLHKQSSATAALDHQLGFGARFNVYQSHGQFLWGQEETESGQGYVGYVARAALSPEVSTPTHHIAVLRAPVFAKEDLKSHIRRFLPLNARIQAHGRNGDFVWVNGQGFIHVKHIAPLTEFAADFVAIAERFLGLPYVWGGAGPDGVDCSGLVQTALRAAGRDCLRDADLQEKTLGSALDDGEDLQLEALHRGDLVFWPGHVGIMRDAQTLLHANAHHMLVASEPLVKAVKRIEPISGPITSIKRV